MEPAAPGCVTTVLMHWALATIILRMGSARTSLGAVLEALWQARCIPVARRCIRTWTCRVRSLRTRPTSA